MTKKKMCFHDLDSESVVKVLEANDLKEFSAFVVEKNLDGRKLLEVTEGIVKLWKPKINAIKLITFIEEIKHHPDKYLNVLQQDEINEIKSIDVESQYQTVRKVKTECGNVSASHMSSVEEILKRIVPAKSFLYGNERRKAASYTPMEAVQKRPNWFHRLSSYEPRFDLKSRFSKNEKFGDRGYYTIKTENKICIKRICKKSESRSKYNSLGSTTIEESREFPEDHLYEDLNYYDVKDEVDTREKGSESNFNQIINFRPKMVRFQEYLKMKNPLKMPFFKKNDEPEIKSEEPQTKPEKDDATIEEAKKAEIVINNKENNIYENAENMYDSVRANPPCVTYQNLTGPGKLEVEEYLDPVDLNKDYCDVTYKQKDDSLLGYILSIFESRFGMRRETNETTHLDDSCDTCQEKDGRKGEKTDIRKGEKKPNMAERPLPVPIENEPYYMDIDRMEAENLLKGQPDGMFILRPSSQPNHAYTLSVACAGAVHNVGVRSRPDGRLALGFARKGEQSFVDIPTLLRYHRKRRLMLVVAGGVLGATTLNDTPCYYQTPNNIPL